MDFQVVISSSTIYLCKRSSDGVGVSSAAEPVSVENLTVPNSAYSVPNAIGENLNKMINKKILSSVRSSRETCLLVLSIEDRRSSDPDNKSNNADTGYFCLSDMSINGILDLLASVAGGAENVAICLGTQLKEANRAVFVDLFPNLEIKQRNGVGYVDFTFKFPIEISKENWNAFHVQHSLKLKIYVHFKEQAVNHIHKNGLEHESSLKLLEGLLLDAPRSGDVCIKTGDHEEIRCHRAILTSSTDYFKAMFQSGMQEERTGVIHMPDMNEEAVRALLAYLYQKKISIPLNSCSVAYQLLVAADRCQLLLLYSSMTEIILHKKSDWCSVETALDLYFFAKNRKIEGKENMSTEEWLQRKALEILGSKTRDALDKCPAFQQAFVSEGQPGKKLCMDLLLMQKEVDIWSSNTETDENNKNNDERGGNYDDNYIEEEFVPFN